jgi:MscS family membrane protein
MKRLVLFFLIIFSAVSNAQESIDINLRSPNAAIYTHLYFLQSDSYEPEKAAKTILPNSIKNPKKAVIKLKQILDGKGLFVDFKLIPTNANYIDSTSYTIALNKYVLFPERMPLISVEKIGNNWYYSSETIQNLDQVYNDVFPWYVVKLESLVPDVGHRY